MGTKNYDRQKELWRSWIPRICLAVALTAIVVTAWLWVLYITTFVPLDYAAERTAGDGAPAAAIATGYGGGEARAAVESTREVKREFEDPQRLPDPPSPAARLSAERERTLPELERQFLAEREKDAQVDIVTEIAGHNDAAAVLTLARLFPKGRNPEVKEAVLARLADINADAAPAARIALLESALAGQPRNVRLTAIDALADSDDPRALAALRRAAQSDPDRLLREAAAAYAEVVEGRQR